MAIWPSYTEECLHLLLQYVTRVVGMDSDMMLVDGTITGMKPTSGWRGGGTQVTIVGQNLGSGSDITEVYLGIIAAKILQQSAENIVVQSRPAVASSGHVQVRSVTRGTTTSTFLWTYLPGTELTGKWPIGRN